MGSGLRPDPLNQPIFWLPANRLAGRFTSPKAEISDFRPVFALFSSARALLSFSAGEAYA
jgi:hypothetical protein